MSDRVFTITVEGDYELTVNEIWPDGDAPENPTAEDVKEQLESQGPKYRVLDDWGISDYDVSVEGVKVWPRSTTLRGTNP